MKREVQTVVDKEFINAIVEKAFQGEGTVIVRDDGDNSARIENGWYIIGKRRTKNLESLKEIFFQLIMRHHAFEHNGTKFSYYDGKWRIKSDKSPQD